MFCLQLIQRRLIGFTQDVCQVLRKCDGTKRFVAQLGILYMKNALCVIVNVKNNKRVICVTQLVTKNIIHVNK